MPEKSDKELAVELAKAMLEHNAKISVSDTSKDTIIKPEILATEYIFFLKVVKGEIGINDLRQK